jgi:hypothetical protein
VKSDFEYMNYSDGDRLAMLETRAAQLERMLGSPGPEHAAPVAPVHHASPETDPYAGYEEQAEPQWPSDGVEADDRTEVLINRGRQNARRSRLGPLRGHWRLAAAVAGALLVLVIILVTVVPGGNSGSWPSSVATVQKEITVACQNENVAAEPSQANFACGTGTRQILWVFALLTSGDNPGYVDPSTGRKGLEPITPAQGGDVAWSLNLHQPYNPASAVDSLEVAARAINNIIAGATLTSSSGSPSVESGLESSGANCQRYTGSSALTTRPGYPASCAHPVTSSAGQAALVSDVFRQWMVGAPAKLSSEAGVLFVNSNNPGNPQVQQILNSLPGSGL